MEVEQKYPELDVLVNNAGIQYNYNLLEASDIHQKIQNEINTNLTGTIQLTQLLLPILSTKPSVIVNVTSGLGAVPKTDGLIYSVSKAGLRNFTLGLRKSLNNNAIKVLEIIPPVTNTNMTSGRDEQKMSVEELVRIIIKQWQQGKILIAPGKIKLFLLINRFLPVLANRIIH